MLNNEWLGTIILGKYQRNEYDPKHSLFFPKITKRKTKKQKENKKTKKRTKNYQTNHQRDLLVSIGISETIIANHKLHESKINSFQWKTKGFSD